MGTASRVGPATVCSGLKRPTTTPQLIDRALYFFQRSLDGGGGKSKKTDKTARIFLADARQGVVRLARQRRGPCTIKSIGSGRRHAQDLDVDAEAIHMLDPTARIAALKCRRIDSALQRPVVEITHTAVGIRRLQNHIPLDAGHLA